MEFCLRSRRGNATLEFVFVGIPLIFVLISTFEAARGMWIYHSLAYAVKEGTRYTIVRGQNSPTPATVAGVCTAIVQAGSGLLPEDLRLTFTSAGASFGPINAAMDCSQNTSTWPSGIGNQPGQSISIRGTYPFQSAIAMFWPGAGPPTQFPAFTFPATSQEVMQF